MYLDCLCLINKRYIYIYIKGSRLLCEHRVHEGWGRANYLIFLVQNSLAAKLAHQVLKRGEVEN